MVNFEERLERILVVIVSVNAVFCAIVLFWKLLTLKPCRQGLTRLRIAVVNCLTKETDDQINAIRVDNINGSPTQHQRGLPGHSDLPPPYEIAAAYPPLTTVLVPAVIELQGGACDKCGTPTEGTPVSQRVNRLKVSTKHRTGSITQSRSLNDLDLIKGDL